MQCDSDVYEETEEPRQSMCDDAYYEKVEVAPTTCNEDELEKDGGYERVRKLSNVKFMCEHPVVSKPRSKKAMVALGLTFATLGLLLIVVAAIAVHALTETSKLKSKITSVDLKLQQNDSSSQMQMRNLEGRIQQLQGLSNFTADMVAMLNDEVTSLNLTIQQMLYLLDFTLSPAPHCDALPTFLPAGYYYILSSTGSAVRQYCPSITTRCGQTGRWRSVANLDMTRTNSQCPADLILHRNFSKTFCIRHSINQGCSSVQLPTTTPYRSVCGFVKAYQFGQPEAFNGLSSIDTYYVDGVSITHGSPRQHIWTFAATWNENTGIDGCFCMGGSNYDRPSFVGNDYFCDTGTSTGNGAVFYGNDPLWDGAGCGPTNNCCSFNTPPWFYKELPQYSYNNIELRICSNQERSNEDSLIEAFTIYVK